MRSVRMTCPRNCYDTCGMTGTVEDGMLRRVDGDPLHPVTRGRLCAKGYSYVDTVYATNRLRHPMLQSPRGSGNWQRLTWDEALEMIARRILDIFRRHGSLLPLFLYRGSGNLGVLHAAPNALFRSIAPFTEAAFTMCWSTGYDATRLDFGDLRTSDIGELQNARTLLLWGMNPAWTAPHLMDLVMQARDRGTRVIVIDPTRTATASRADLHLAIRPGTDGALALGMARAILDASLTDEAFLRDHVLGWREYRAYLESEVTLEWAAAETGVPADAIRDVARAYATGGPATIWIGFGMQRYLSGGQSVRAIDALAALTGQIGRPGTGVQFAHRQTELFGGYLASFDRDPAKPNRLVPTGATGQMLAGLTAPAIEMAWIAQANPVSQEAHSAQMRAALAALPFVVVVDAFLTHTAQQADIVLPITTFAESWDLNVSYWHHYASVNQPAIAPCYEARSDLAIAWMLSRTLNRLAPGVCDFPTEGYERDWVMRAWQSDRSNLFRGIGFEEVLAHPVRAGLPEVAWDTLRFATPSGRIELNSRQAAVRGLPAIAEYRPPVEAPPGFPYRLLTAHTVESLHSQFHAADLGLRATPYPVVEVHPSTAADLGVRDGEYVRLFNLQGELQVRTRVTQNVQPDILVAYETWYAGQDYNVNELTEAIPGPLEGGAGFAGGPYAECFVGVEPLPRRG